MPRRVAAEARWVDGFGFVAHDPATGKRIPTYWDFAYGATAVARDNNADDVSESVKTWKAGATPQQKADGSGINKAVVLPCFVTVPD